MNNELTHEHYRKSVRAIAEDIWEHVKVDADNSDEAEHDAYEAVDAWIYQCKWLIGRIAPMAVLLYSTNRDAAFDELGPDDALTGCRDLETMGVRLATWAMMRDVSEELKSVIETIPFFREWKD